MKTEQEAQEIQKRLNALCISIGSEFRMYYDNTTENVEVYKNDGCDVIKPFMIVNVNCDSIDTAILDVMKALTKRRLK